MFQRRSIESYRPGRPGRRFYIDHLWYNYMSTYTQKEGTIKEFSTMIFSSIQWWFLIGHFTKFRPIRKVQWVRKRHSGETEVNLVIIQWLAFDLEWPRKRNKKKTTKIKFCRKFDWSTAIEQSEIMDHYTLSIKCMGWLDLLT